MASVKLQDIFSYATNTGKSSVQAAIEMGYHNPMDQNLWPEPKSGEFIQQELESKEIISMQSGRSDLLSRCARDIARSVQFPVSTAFLHGMGIIATAMTPFFRYRYFDSIKHCNLYIITSQPTGAGKSAMNDYFYKPVEVEYERVSKENAKDRRRCMLQIEQYEEQLKTTKRIEEIVSLENSIQNEQEKLRSFPKFTYTWTDVTPEALEACAAKQDGLFNLVSDEATVINSLLGDMYSDRMKNNELLLKGWDGDLVSSARVTRKGFYGTPNGNVVVCAQDETIKAILLAGERGNGICQRFLLHREPNMMGHRKYGRGVYQPTSKELKAEYCRLVNAITREKEVTLDFSDEAMDIIYSVKSQYESTIADNGKNSQEMIRGVVAKIDKQIMKISCILHVMKEWGDKGQRSKVISADTVSWGYSIYDALIDSFINSASSQGYIGKTVEVEKVKDKLSGLASKGVYTISMRKLRDNLKGVQPFKGHTTLGQHLRDVVIPALEEDGWAHLNGNDLMINPKLKW